MPILQILDRKYVDISLILLHWFSDQPCPCGSGRKYKKCCRNKKQRTTVVEGYFSEPTAINNMRFNILDGSVGFFLNDERKPTSTAISTLSYEGENRKKILSQIPSEGSGTKAYVDANLPQYDNIVAIDTNYKSIGKEQVCVVAAVAASPSMHPGKVRLRVTKCLAIEFWNPITLPERIGWRLAMGAIMDTEEYVNGESFGVIVDSELGNISSFNKRESEILHQFNLPDRMTMIYGSSDKKTDSAINGLMHLTDKTSNAIHKQISSNGYCKSGESISNYFTDERHWDNVGHLLNEAYNGKKDHKGSG